MPIIFAKKGLNYSSRFETYADSRQLYHLFYEDRLGKQTKGMAN